MFIWMNEDLLLLVFACAQPSLYQGEWFMNLTNCPRAALSFCQDKDGVRGYVLCAMFKDAENCHLRAMDFLLILCRTLKGLKKKKRPELGVCSFSPRLFCWKQLVLVSQQIVPVVPNPQQFCCRLPECRDHCVTGVKILHHQIHLQPLLGGIPP